MDQGSKRTEEEQGHYPVILTKQAWSENQKNSILPARVVITAQDSVHIAHSRSWPNNIINYQLIYMWLNNIYAKLNSSGAGQQSPPLQFMTYRAALGVLQGPFFVRGKCCFSFIALHADHSGSTLLLQIVADSCSFSSLPSWNH